jgi:hypothetical protein
MNSERIIEQDLKYLKEGIIIKVVSTEILRMGNVSRNILTH